MKCPNCRCEIGNLTECPYCGARLYRRTESQYARSTTPVGRSAPTIPVPTRQVQAQKVRPKAAPITAEQRMMRHLNNIDTWGRVCAVLLSGIFALQILQLILFAIK